MGKLCQVVGIITLGYYIHKLIIFKYFRGGLKCRIDIRIKNGLSNSEYATKSKTTPQELYSNF